MISQEHKQKFIEYFMRTGKLNDALYLFEQEFYKIARCTGRNILKESGINYVSQHGGIRAGLNDQEIQMLYEKYAGDPNLAAKEAGYKSVSSMVLRFRKLGLESKVKNTENNRISNEAYTPHNCKSYLKIGRSR